MKRKTYHWVILIVFIVVIVVVWGWRSNEKTVNIVWQTEYDTDQYEEYFNKVLKDKHYPYEVDFVKKDTIGQEQTADLIEV